MFKALVIDSTDGSTNTSIQNLDDARLPVGNVTVAVEYSTLNYKDGLVVTGAGGFVKQYPHVPGVDFAGTVIQSGDPTYKPGDKVILTGWRVGEVRWGGLSQKATANAGWLGPLPSRATPRAGHGDWHRRIYRDAGGHRARSAWPHAEVRRGACDGRRGGRRIRGHGDS